MKRRLKWEFAGKMILFLTLTLANVYVVAGEAQAALDCNGCHGTSSPTDYRPYDAAYRNITTGGFRGNHRTHMALTANQASCTPCHNNSGFTSSHRNGKIQLSSNINTSPATGKYMKYGFQAFTSSQVSNPTLGTCATVNCHFETVSPVWGTSSSLTTCDTCHSSQPSTLSHARHEAYYGGSGSCIKCHPARPTFSHATSAGDRGISLNSSVNYAGSNNQYLPSQSATRVLGNCSNLYCHSDGTKNAAPFTGSTNPTWGATLTCGSCHGDATTLNTNSHAAHIRNGAVTGVNITCDKCHNATTNDGTSITGIGFHNNNAIDVAFSGAGTYSNSGHAPGAAAGTCSAVSCHFSGATGTVTWGANLGSVTCEKCHGSANTAGTTGLFAATSGATAASDAKAGTHVSHLAANTSYGKKIAVNVSCTDCHKSVAFFNATTHIHNGQSVGAAGMYWSNLANNNGALSPTYNTTNGQCSNVYCHGATLVGGLNKTPAWNSTTYLNGTISDCGQCHGDPPQNTGHLLNGGPSYVAQNSCNSCHSHVNTDGLTFNDTTKHINGTIDGGTCNACHGYPPVKDMAGIGVHNNYTTARLQNYSGGGGAHNIPGHLALIVKATDTWSPCAICHPTTSHNQGGGVFVPSNVQVAVDPKFKFDSKLPITYTGHQSGAPYTTGSCSNVSCHFKASPKWSTER